VLAAGLGAAIAAGESKSLPLLVIGAAAAGVGHGLAFINAQQELNELAPKEHRGEVTSAFIAAIYATVAAAVIGTGALDEWLSLTVSFGVVAAVVAVLALAVAVWQVEPGRERRRSTRRTPQRSAT
jgi:MFS family permease